MSSIREAIFERCKPLVKVEKLDVLEMGNGLTLTIKDGAVLDREIVAAIASVSPLYAITLECVQRHTSELLEDCAAAYNLQTVPMPSEMTHVETGRSLADAVDALQPGGTLLPPAFYDGVASVLADGDALRPRETVLPLDFAVVAVIQGNEDAERALTEPPVFDDPALQEVLELTDVEPKTHRPQSSQDRLSKKWGKSDAS